MKLVNLVHDESGKYGIIAVVRQEGEKHKILAFNYRDTEFTDEGEVVLGTIDITIYEMLPGGELKEVEIFEFPITDFITLWQLVDAGIRRILERTIKVAEVLQDASKTNVDLNSGVNNFIR